MSYKYVVNMLHIIIFIIINASILHAKRQTVLHVRITDVDNVEDFIDFFPKLFYG